jgi:hypothetical protein
VFANAAVCPQVLQHWLVLLRHGELLTQFAGQLQQLMSQRCGAGEQGHSVPVAAVAAAGDSAQLQQLCQQLIQEVQSLLQVRGDFWLVVCVLRRLLADTPSAVHCMLQLISNPVQQEVRFAAAGAVEEMVPMVA